ncbi:CSC1-like protein ERD4 (Protein EARLY-RESPONSIVE TO DEHYDRATION STRESS 4) [Durusdinium trenchii]|uniref:CSC1-like protein ERD4 (Protein EARLY-RESPONSIVE TO DEHYDRATION STRESS 4) n=1 Tax=Durusdinium trenchii TaxID=1381693 RepID=A0ABP0RFX9_9DINO
MIGDERFLSKDGLLRTTLPSLRLASSLRRFVAKGRSTSSPTLGPLGPTITLKPYSADNPQNPNFSPDVRPGFLSASFEPVSPALDVNNINVNWSRGVTPPRLLFGGGTMVAVVCAAEWTFEKCHGSDKFSANAAPVACSYANVSMAMVREQARRSVVLERLPRELRDPGALRSCLEDLLGHNAVLCVAFAPSDARRLSECMEERNKLRSQSTQLSKVLLMRMEDRLAERRDDFARARTRSEPLLADFLLGFVEAVELRPEEWLHQLGAELQLFGLGVHSDARDAQVVWAEERLSCRTGCRALCTSLRIVSWVMKEANPANPVPRWGRVRARARRARCLRIISASAAASIKVHQLVALCRVTDKLALDLGPPGVVSMLPAIGLGTLLGAATGVVTMGTAVWIGAGTAAGIGAGKWLVDRIIAKRRLATGQGPRQESELPPALQAALLGWQNFLASKAQGSSITSRQLAELWSQFEAENPDPRHGYQYPWYNVLESQCYTSSKDAVLGTGMQVFPAPEPRDLVWHNVARPETQLLVRQFFVEIALLFGLAFWSVPVSLLQVWCSWARLSQILPWLQLPESMHGTDLEALVTLYMPAALLVLLEVLPIMLHRLASRYEGVKSWSALQMRTMRRYWRFQLATIGVTVLSGSVSNSLTAMLDQPTSMLWELGQSLPQVAVYFLATVLSSALVVGPVSLLRLPLLVQLTWTALARRLREILCLGSSTSAQAESNFLAAAAEDCLDTPPMAADLSALLLVLLVCVTYASIAPLIILAGALFFALRWLVLALRYLYVHVPRFDSGGAFWYLLWNQAGLALELPSIPAENCEDLVQSSVVRISVTHQGGEDSLVPMEK